MEESGSQHEAIVQFESALFARWRNCDGFNNNSSHEVDASNCEHPDGSDFSSRGLDSAVGVSVELEFVQPVQTNEAFDVLDSSELGVDPIVELNVEWLSIVIFNQVLEVGRVHVDDFQAVGLAPPASLGRPIFHTNLSVVPDVVQSLEPQDLLSELLLIVVSSSESVNNLFAIFLQFGFTFIVRRVLVDESESKSVLSPVNSDLLVELVSRSFEVVGLTSVVERIFQSVVVEVDRDLVPDLSLHFINRSHEVPSSRLHNLLLVGGLEDSV
jgi:hypothetical protein